VPVAESTYGMTYVLNKELIKTTCAEIRLAPSARIGEDANAKAR